MACFPQIPCNHGSVIKRSDFLLCATSHFPEHTTEVVFDQRFRTNVHQHQQGSLSICRQTVSSLSFKITGECHSAETPNRKWNQKCTSKRVAAYRDEQISCQKYPFHLCLSCSFTKKQDSCPQVEHFTNLTCLVRHLTFHVTQRLLHWNIGVEKMERGN